MSEIFHPVFDWWQALLAISYDNEKFLSMLKNHPDIEVALNMPPISDGWFLTKAVDR